VSGHRRDAASPVWWLVLEWLLTGGFVIALIVLSVLNAMAGNWLIFWTAVVVLLGLAWDTCVRYRG
jgi:hypothetical protein